MGTSMGGLQMIETLKATGGEAEFFGRWAGYQAKSLVGEQGLSVISETTGTVPALVGTLATLIVYVMAGFKVMNGEFTIGMLVAYQTLVASFNRPLASLVSFSGLLQELRGDMTRLDDVIAYPQDPQYSRFDAAEKGEDRAALKLSGKVELRGITFGYSPLEPPLIEDFNLVVEPGRARGARRRQRQRQVHGRQAGGGAVRAVGGRGVVRRCRADGAAAPFDHQLGGGGRSGGVPVRRHHHRERAMWDSTLPPARVMTACRDAAIDDVIEAREGRYDAVLEEGGKNMSGGQRQRLEIARALAGEPTIVVLDEATSALDSATETIIDESLRRRGCTCIIIAHRLSTIRDADKILVMRRGKVVQEGTHDIDEGHPWAVPGFDQPGLTRPGGLGEPPFPRLHDVSLRIVSTGAQARAAGETIPLTADRVTIGRGNDCVIVLQDGGVSRHHAVIESTPTGYRLRDTGSANGVFVADERKSEVALTHGLQFGIGDTVFEFVNPLVEPAPPAAAGSSSFELSGRRPRTRSARNSWCPASSRSAAAATAPSR